MLFNSYIFILLFLPLVAWIFYVCSRRDQKVAAAWLALASLFFYGWWNPKFIFLLCVSICFNFFVGKAISNQRGEAWGKVALLLAITANLLLLLYFKYFNFFIATANVVTGSSIDLTDIALPLGISFFTFTQIVFLVDAYRGLAAEHRFIHYVLFVSYFPHLIAGPILHHRQIMPQFAAPNSYRADYNRFAIGITIFVIGLAKKVLIADRLAPYANGIFETAESGGMVTLFEAWLGALAYTVQLYFDFSGYSDMAIGASYIFGISLPINFSSPYKAASIIEFWRCWHMTLSEFLRNYLYIPLGGNKFGGVRRYVNLMVTMVLGGLWHGANWTFVAWGTLHGIYLVVNHAWRNAFPSVLGDRSSAIHRLSIGMTFLAVVVAWVLFRAETFSAAVIMYKGMLGLGGVSLPPYIPEKFSTLATFLKGLGVTFNGIAPVTNYSMRNVLALLAVSMVVCFALPNTQQLMHQYMPGQTASHSARVEKPGSFQWQPTAIWGCLIAALAGVSFLGLTQASHFLYFQF